MVNQGNLLKLKIFQAVAHGEKSDIILQVKEKVHLTNQSPISIGTSTWSLTLRGFSLVFTSLMPLFGTLHIVFTSYSIASSKRSISIKMEHYAIEKFKHAYKA